MSEDPFHSHVRLTGAERGKLLARLDEAPGRPGRDRRRHKRWEYRMSARPDTRGGWSRSRPRAVPPAWGRCARPGLRRMVSDFIDEAQRKANQIEKSLAAETGNPRDACVELLGAAAGYGFDAMTEAARDALAALDTTEKRKDAEGPLRRLVAICRRLRCATRVRPGLAA